MKLIIDLDEATLRRLLEEGGRVVVDAVLHGTGDNPRLEAIERNVKRVEAKQRGKAQHAKNPPVRIGETDRRLIACWNNHPYMLELAKDRGDEVRNFPVRSGGNKALISLLHKGTKFLGENGIVTSMNHYMEICSTGGHVWEGRNRGFRSLDGFLKSALKYHRRKESPWWIKRQQARPYDDPDPDTTGFLIRVYAGVFLGGREYHPSNPSKEYLSFIRAAGCMVQFMKEYNLTDKVEIAKALVTVVREMNEGSTTHPGHLASNHVWQIEMPQKLEYLG